MKKKHSEPPTPGDVIIRVTSTGEFYIFEVEGVEVTPVEWKIFIAPGSGYKVYGHTEHMVFESCDVRNIPQCAWYKAIESFPEVFREYEKLNSV